MANDPIISVSGLRGIVGDTLSPEVARRYAAAFAQILPPGSVLVTRDGRANGGALVSPVVAGLTAKGDRTALDGGVAATPTTGVLVRQHGCAGGIQISASHNPAEYNGIKLIGPGGYVVAASIGEEVRARYAKLSAAEIPELPAAPPVWLDDTISAHLALVEDIIDVARIRTRRFRVLLDSNHGSGGLLGQTLLEYCGCDVRMVGEKPDGLFEHPPEPTAENLASVLARVTKLEANIGFCQDPDADRLAIIDESGNYLGEEYTLAMCAEHVVRQTPGPLVMNCSTSRMTEDVARKYRVPFYRSKVGEANVVEMMLAHEAVFGGEGNGGVIDPRVGLIRDSFVGMALVLDAMAGRGLAVSALAAELPRYAICKTTIQLEPEKVAVALDALETQYASAEHDRLDGLRLDWGNPDGSGCWLLVRPSNTEPIVRLVAEAPTAEGAQRLCDEGKRVIREATG